MAVAGCRRAAGPMCGPSWTVALEEPPVPWPAGVREALPTWRPAAFAFSSCGRLGQLCSAGPDDPGSLRRRPALRSVGDQCRRSWRSGRRIRVFTSSIRVLTSPIRKLTSSIRVSTCARVADEDAMTMAPRPITAVSTVPTRATVRPSSHDGSPFAAASSFFTVPTYQTPNGGRQLEPSLTGSL